MTASHFLVSVVAIAISTGSACGFQLNEDFESYPPGALPGGPWLDVVTRISVPTTPIPTANVIDTIDAFGNPTRAVQQVDANGTSSGVLAEIGPTDLHTFQVDFRIDQFSDRNAVHWPIATGYIQDAGAPDPNEDPQALAYVINTDRRLRFFVKNQSGVGGPSFDTLVTPFIIPLDHWYRVQIDSNGQTGAFRIIVVDLELGKVVAERNDIQVPNWNPTFGAWDAVTSFDGEYQGVGGTRGGLATIDNVIHEPVAECTRSEKVKKANCRNGTVKVVVKGGNDGERTRCTLNSGETRVERTRPNGKAKFKFKKVPPGSLSAKVNWACSASESKSLTCR